LATYKRPVIPYHTAAMSTADKGSPATTTVGSGWHCCLASVTPTDHDENSDAATRPTRISLPLLSKGKNGSNSKDSVVLSALSLEEAIESCLHFPYGDEVSSGGNDDNASSDDEEHEPVKFLHSEDSHLLKCRRPKRRHGDGGNVGATILGIEENKSLYNYHMMDTTEVEVTVHLPSNIQDGIGNVGCCCDHPMGNWDRVRDGTNVNTCSTTGTSNGTSCDQSPSYHPRLRIVDLTQLQLQRRATDSASSAIKPALNGPGNVCHLLRSVLSCPGSSSHCASPWEGRYVDLSERQQQQSESHSPCRGRDEVIAILLLGHHETAVHASSAGGNIRGEDKSKWNKVERLELSDLVKFRTGDATPSYFLYSMSQLDMPLTSSGDYSSVDLSTLLGSPTDNKTNHDEGRDDTLAVTMLVYRHLPPRDVLSRTHPAEGTVVDNSHDPYYLWEAYQPPLVKPEELSDPMLIKVQEDEPPPIQYRLVAPPYQSCRDLYPGLFNEIMKPESIRAIAEEALNIPQWTAWPEKNHYSSPDDEDGDGVEDRKNSPYPATWTVFPLCHTFPANVLANRKWIGKTCNFVPHTAALLESLGPALRTALFSRLEPQTTLSAHTGWADLANHVLRVHIPIVVPEGEQNLGLCGTWVDGCVETHRMGEIICFDDSKVHRAFNYTNEERIVLIVDLARTDVLPVGTATGGHTDELDAFIKEIS